jgi:hypothetical protein
VTIRQAAYELGRSGTLPDPTDEDIILYAVEMAKGRWPEDFNVDRWFGDEIIAEFERGTQDRDKPKCTCRVCS